MRKVVCKQRKCFLDNFPENFKLQTGKGRMGKFNNGAFFSRNVDYVIPLIQANRIKAKIKNKRKAPQSGNGAMKTKKRKVKQTGSGKKKRSVKKRTKASGSKHKQKKTRRTKKAISL